MVANTNVYLFLDELVSRRKKSKIGQFLARIFEPILEPFRRIIPPIGMFDISSLVAYIIFQYAMRVLTGLIQVYVIPMLF